MAAQTTTIRVVADTSQAERALGGLADSLRNLAAIGAVSALAKQFVDLADSATVLSNKMRTVTNSSADAGIAFNNVIAIAKKTGMEVSAVGDLFQKVALAGRLMGLSLDDTSKITENFTKALAVTGTVGPAATSAIYQFGQALGRGTVVFEDMKQLQESSAGTLELIAQQFGKTTQQFLKDIQASKVGSRDLAAALKQLEQDVDPTFNNMQKTVGQSLAIVRAEFVNTIQKFEDATGTFDKLAKGIQWVGNNLDVVIPLAAALVGAFAAARLAAIIGGLAQMAMAIRTIGTTAAVAQALATGGLSAIAAAAGATAAYLAADKLFGDMEKSAALKKQADEAKRLADESKRAGDNSRKILTYQGADIDLKGLRESADTFLLQTRLMTQMIGLGKQRAEQEKAVADFAREQKVSYDKIKNTQAAADIRSGIAQRQNAETLAQLQSDLLTMKAQAAAYTAKDSLEALKIITLDQLRVQYGTAISQKTAETVAHNTVLAKVKADAYAIERDTNALIERGNDFRFNINRLSLQEIEIRQEILGVQAQLGYELEKEQRANLENNFIIRKRLEYFRQIKSAVEAVNSPLTGFAAGASAAGQLGQLDPMQQALTANQTLMNGLENLRNQDLISHQQYERAKMMASIQAQEAIMDATRKKYEAENLLRIQSQTGTQFSYETQKQMARDAAAFEMKSNMEKTQFALSEAANSLNIMGQQNRKAFEAAKAFNIANALMNTYMGATKALATYPWPLGPIFAALTIGAGMAQVAQIRSQQYSGRQLGGPVMRGNSYVVGEAGPELFTPNTTGSITRNQDAFGNGGNVNVNFTINAVDAASFDGLLVQRRGLITQIISDAMMEKGQRGI